MGDCRACGNANPEQARFCFACGTPLTVPAAEGRKTITVLFLDLTGSTSLAEAMDPESYRHVMTRFFGDVSTVIERHGGKVEKFIGDAVMATYGIPVLREDDALRAVRAAVELRTAMQSLNEDLERQFGLRLSIRTGINTGEVVVGASMGGQDIALGDVTNVAARLEQSAQPDEILIGESTYQLVRRLVEATPVGPLSLKGKQQGVAAYRLHDVVGATPGGGRDLARPMIGREHELAIALDAVELTVARHMPQLVAVTGSPGLGKSRLVSAVVEHVAGRAVVVVGNCLPYGEGITYSPIASVIRQLCAAFGAGAGAPEDVATLVGTIEHADLVIRRLEQLLGSGATTDAPDEISWAVGRLLEQAATRRPVVVVLEDLHWAERPLLDLVEHVATWIKDVPLLLLTSTRPELPERRPFWATRPRQISLEPLDPERSRQLVRQAAGDVPVSDAVTRRIADATGGNPLFVEQTLSMLLDAGAGGVGRLDTADIPVPPSISALLAARVDSLDRGDRELLEHASVIGSEFSLTTLSHLSGGESAHVLSRALDTLVRKDFLETARFDAPGEQTFRFRHALIREAAYAALSKARRATLHEEVGAWLEQQRADGAFGDEELVGFHLERAYRYKQELRIDGGRQAELAERAARCLGRAGGRARARQDMRGAVGLLSRAVELAVGEDVGKARLLLELGAARVDTGDSVGAQQAFRQATEIASRAGDRLVESEALLSLADVLSRTDSSESTSDRLFDQIEQGIALFEQFDHWQGLAIAWNTLSHIQNVRGCQTAKQRAAENAVHYAQLAQDSDIEAWARYGIVSALKSGPAPLEDAVAHGEELVTWARASGNRQLEGLTLGTLAHMYAMKAQPERARAAAVAAREILDQLGAQLVLAIQLRSESFVERLAGDLPAAAQLLRDSYALLEQMGDKTFRSSVAAALADVLHLQGEYADAGRYTAITRELAAPDDLDAQVGWMRVQAKLLARRGDVAGGERLARQAVALLADNDTVYLQVEALSDLADVLAMGGRDDEARAIVEHVLELYDAKQNLAEARELRRRWSWVEPVAARTD